MLTPMKMKRYWMLMMVIVGLVVWHAGPSALFASGSGEEAAVVVSDSEPPASIVDAIAPILMDRRSQQAIANLKHRSFTDMTVWSDLHGYISLKSVKNADTKSLQLVRDLEKHGIGKNEGAASFMAILIPQISELHQAMKRVNPATEKVGLAHTAFVQSLEWFAEGARLVELGSRKESVKIRENGWAAVRRALEKRREALLMFRQMGGR
ncbi:MAG TPA: hypothetical protein PKO06_08120 [Candidatus Ozemobacteraceae bacterium]|nr:hypothetical protein [Candidatus Ozemobacteraceae bacterium]